MGPISFYLVSMFFAAFPTKKFISLKILIYNTQEISAKIGYTFIQHVAAKDIVHEN